MGGLAAVWRALRTGRGEHVDVSLMEAMTIANSTYGDLGYRLTGSPPITAPMGDPSAVAPVSPAITTESAKPRFSGETRVAAAPVAVGTILQVVSLPPLLY